MTGRSALATVQIDLSASGSALVICQRRPDSARRLRRRDLDRQPEIFFAAVSTVEHVVRLLKVSPRWLAAQCHTENVEHVHIARQRRFTRQQVDALIASKTVRPTTDRELDKTRERVMR